MRHDNLFLPTAGDTTRVTPGPVLGDGWNRGSGPTRHAERIPPMTIHTKPANIRAIFTARFIALIDDAVAWRGGKGLVLLGIFLVGLLIVAVLGLAGAIAFGGPTHPPPLASIRDAVLKRNRTDLPKPIFFRRGIRRRWHIAPIQPLPDRPGAPLY
jgi:hypothetical protein